ncbi:MAG TPA: ribosomal protein S18-alanine N-acetyltransferase [Actinomycetes bacterium]|nr:ribosomal protein S18-alanine N-acetyltransferase [Actinomycetes bacterium]
MSAATLRPMRWWDVEELAALEEEAFPDLPWSAAAFWSELAGVPLTRWYVVAEEDGGIAGYAGLFATGPEADVQTVAVRPDRRGSGLADRLVTALLEEAGRRGAARVLLEVRDDNTPALRLYERHGFAAVGRRRGYYGPGRDAVVMARRLGAGTA